MTPEPSTTTFTPPDNLHDSDVYVFACSQDGLHGSGDAGWAFKGTAASDWYSNSEFRSLVASPTRKGHRAVWYRAEGWHEGTRGQGYAIAVAVDSALTVASLYQENPRKYRERLQKGVEQFLREAAKHPDRRYVIGPIGLKPEFGGCGLLCPDEVREVWSKALAGAKTRLNLVFPKDLEPLANAQDGKDLHRGGIDVGDLPANSSLADCGPHDVFIGRHPGKTSVLWVDEAKWGTLDREAKERAYRLHILHLLAKEAGLSDKSAASVTNALREIQQQAVDSGVRLVTIGESGSVKGTVLKEMILTRLRATLVASVRL